MAGTPAICKTASVQCDPISSFWVRNPQVPVFRDLGCSAGASLLPSLWGLKAWQGGSLVSGGVRGTLSGKSVYWGRSPGQISEGKSRSQHSPGTISWHTVSSPILHAVLWLSTRRPLSAPSPFVLSACHPNSFILQTRLVHSPIRTRTGLAIVSLAAACGDSGFIPIRGFRKALCEVKRGMKQDLKSR